MARELGRRTRWRTNEHPLRGVFVFVRLSHLRACSRISAPMFACSRAFPHQRLKPGRSRRDKAKSAEKDARAARFIPLPPFVHASRRCQRPARPMSAPSAEASQTAQRSSAFIGDETVWLHPPMPTRLREIVMGKRKIDATNPAPPPFWVLPAAPAGPRARGCGVTLVAKTSRP